MNFYAEGLFPNRPRHGYEMVTKWLLKGLAMFFEGNLLFVGHSQRNPHDSFLG